VDLPATDESKIAEVYDRLALHEAERLDRSLRHRAEFVLTTDLLDEFIDSEMSVLDIGTGPGRYAEHLLRRGARVGLVDLSQRSLDLFEQRMGSAAGTLFCRVGSALALPGIGDANFDAALMMGPLYHLLHETERATALREARRVLRPRGLLVSTHLSPYQPLVDALTRGDVAVVDTLANGGLTTHQGLEQHREWPTQARAALEEADFQVLRVRSGQGLTLSLPDGAWDDAAILAMLRSTSEQPDMLGATWAFSMVSRKS
jgi:ubiquinone/menaquinone biosynthesis C-methylase UbiE